MKCWCGDPATYFYKHKLDDFIFGVCDDDYLGDLSLQRSVAVHIYVEVPYEEAQLYEIKGAL